MTTQGWEALKTRIESLSHRDLVKAGKAFAGALNVPLGDYQKGGKNALANKVKQFAFKYAESHFAAMDRDAAYNLASHRLNDSLVAAVGDESEADYTAESAESLIAFNEMAGNGPSGDDAAKLAELIARMAGSRANVSPELVRAIVKEELKQVPPMVIEVRKDGETMGRIEGKSNVKLPALLKACSSRMTDGFFPNVWISGPSGSGKTHAAMQVSKALGLEFHYNGALSMPHELMGFRDANGTYHATPFRSSYAAKAVYLFDEVDASENGVLLALNAALANGRATFPDGSVSRDPDNRIFAAANTWGMGATADFVGRAKIDAAFLNRFPVKIHFDYDEELERVICGNPDWAMTVQSARAKARLAGLKVNITPRDSMAGAALLAAGFTSQEAKELTFMASLSPDQRKMVGG